MKRPGTVTTIIPVFNRAGMLAEAVASALDQSYPEVEVIIVDDGSTDGTWETCQKLALRDPRVRIRRREHVGKPGLVREAGRLIARGDYIQYLDSDDLLLPDRFSILVEALDRGADLAYSSTRRYAVGEAPGSRPAGRTGETFTRIFPAILEERPWFTASVLYRREICDRAGPWTDLPFLEDVELDARIGRMDARVRHCPEFLADVRDHPGHRVSRQDLLLRAEVLKEAVRAYSMIFSHARAAGVPRTDRAMRLFLEEVHLLGNRAERMQLPTEAETCAAMAREALGPSAQTALTLSAEIDPIVTDLEAKPGERIPCPVRVRNRSTISFRERPWPLYLSYHLLSPSGELLRYDNRRTPFGEVVAPGEERVVDLQIDAPDVAGSYVLAVDVVFELITWFEAEGTPPGIVRLRVDGPVNAPKNRTDG